MRFSIPFLALCLFLLQTGCDTNKTDGRIRTPKESLKAMVVEDGFNVSLVASEPLVIAPVAMVFDGSGRMWLAEMDGYMPDTLATGEDKPVGRVVILEDTDGDGQMDSRKVFLDSLVMPRALCLLAGGLLLAEPPYLWFYEMKDDRPLRKVLVDSIYAQGGNVEHQPNGLLRALDNWIYSAKHDKRYRRLSNGEWKVEHTHFRGQWGISQDNWGKLYYNDNSSNLFGDYFPPGLGANNPNQRSVRGYGEPVVGDTRVYPIRPTTGVNRGYMDGILDSSGRLLNFTAACGPLVYRGGLIAGTNAFVAEPAANLIKRNVLESDGYRTTGQQAYADKEFLASHDERFRPVNLYDGPDGALYILDMYRGIIQHSTYLTPYLKTEIAERQLSLPLGMGRIYRVSPAGAKRRMVKMPDNLDSLIALLGHPNGWVRDQAQREIVDGSYREAGALINHKLTNTHEPMAVIHMLWTLEGLDKLSAAAIRTVMEHPMWEVRAQAITAFPSLVGTVDPGFLATMLTDEARRQDPKTAPYIALILASLDGVDGPTADAIRKRFALGFAADPYVSSALISGLYGKEHEFRDWAFHVIPDTSSALHRGLTHVVQESGKRHGDTDGEAEKTFPKGVALFKTICQPCHGEHGEGVVYVAPPLAKSEWVNGDKQRLISLVLYGLTGPVEVAGRTYNPPDVSGEMPGIVHNPSIDDAELAELLSYIRRAWGNDGDAVLAEDLGSIRSKFGQRKEPFTQIELNGLYGKPMSTVPR